MLVRRYRCRRCGGLTTVLPRGLTARRHYSASAITLDDKGRQLDVEAPGMGSTHFDYDSFGRVIAVTRQAGKESRTKTYTYDDSDGFMRSITDALGQTTAKEPDLVGRLLAITDPSGARFEQNFDRDEHPKRTVHRGRRGRRCIRSIDQMRSSHKVAFVFGLSLVSTGGFLLGRAVSPLFAGPLAMFGVCVAVFSVGRYHLRSGTLATLAVLALLFAGSRAGKLWLYSAIREEVPMLREFTRSLKTPDLRDVPHSRFFELAVVRTEKPPFSRRVVAFPLDDGTVVEFVAGSRAGEGDVPCSDEIAPEWHRKFRCEGR